MRKTYGPINSKCNKILHGADYNPEQWKDMPGIWDEDMRLMELAHCNIVSVGMFSWTALEPEEGKYDFKWLDTIMDNMHRIGGFVSLATPSGARPAWLSSKYPEVLRVRENRVRNLHGGRHNHCFTSPIYREKVQNINRLLAERYKDHPALLIWHISNEYGGECHCELCQEAFRYFLKDKYNGDLDALNRAWWTGFWSHTYTDWSQIESPAPHGESAVHGHNLDWKRFVTHQTVDFYRHEIVPFKEITPEIPVTTNFHDYINIFRALDYWKFVPYIDVISWDNYPYWHNDEYPDWVEGSRRGFIHDMNRSFKGGKPFMLMESSPSATNWQPVAKLRRPGMHALASIQAVAHGSDTVQYFQWRKSRGSSEKFHGAVVDHCGHENTRVFKEVAELGKVLDRFDPIVGTSVAPEVAIIYDWENSWALEDAQGPNVDCRDYFRTCERHYRQFWNRGIPVDVIDMDRDFSGYKVLVAPLMYMVKPGVGERIGEFVKNGGTLITTYYSGIVDENDLCFLGGFPGPLRDIVGIWSEEIDALYPKDRNHVEIDGTMVEGMEGEYEVSKYCDLIHIESAKVLGVYKEDFYAGRPALTLNEHGRGKAYYIAFDGGDDFLKDFYESIIPGLDIKKCLAGELPEGVTAQMRQDQSRDYIFLQNYSGALKAVDIEEGNMKDTLTGEKVEEYIEIPAYGFKILVRE